MPTSLDQAIAEIDRQFAAANAQMAEMSKSEALVEFIAAHRTKALRIVSEAKAHRRWLKQLAMNNRGAGQFFGEHLNHLSSTIAAHRRHIARARAELRALTADQMKEAA